MKTPGAQHLFALLVLALALPIQTCGGGANSAGAPSGPSEPPQASPTSELPPSHPPIAPAAAPRGAEYGVKDGPLAELTVFYFGPDQGGSVEANVKRWLGQLTQPDGKDTASLAKHSTREVSGVSVTQVEATGRFGGSMGMPGAPPAAEIADAMLLGAIASGPQGPVFFKLIGPRADVESARGAFDALIGSLRR